MLKYMKFSKIPEPLDEAQYALDVIGNKTQYTFY